MRLKRLGWWLLMLVALLNSGGIGYWVCHQQINSASFWLKACAGDQGQSERLIPVSAPISAIHARSCDCMFYSVDVPVPQAPRIDWNAPQTVPVAPLDQVSYLPDSFPFDQFWGSEGALPPFSVPLSRVLRRAPPMLSVPC